MERQHPNHEQEQPLPETHNKVFITWRTGIARPPGRENGLVNENRSPSVAILLPVLNEGANIDDCLQSLADQIYEGPIEILVADGGSTDDTMDRLGRWSDLINNLRIYENPDKIQSAGLNLLAEVAHSEILIRADAHTRYARDYVSRSVAALDGTPGTAVGGPMLPEGTTDFGRAVAIAFRSPLAIGPARFHHATKPTEADTVYLGAMQKATWDSLGGMRALPSRVAEDADFYYRLRKAGGRVLVDPAIVSTYRPRATVSDLWRQFYRYGLGKADMLYVNGEFPSWRPLAPLALMLGLAVGLVFLAFGDPRLLTIALVVWLVTLAIASRLNPLVLVATAVMHISYGLGLSRGLMRRPSRVRDWVKAASLT
jgi:glycosyltransferase involved in cell wall biosynthesis